MNQNLIQDYGRFTLQDIIDHAPTYVGQATQQAQNRQMLFNFFIESLTNMFKGQVLLYQSQYQVNNAYNGPALLRQSLSLTYIGTRATAMHLCNSLINVKD